MTAMNKILVVNFTGNVGKSTIAQRMLRPRLPNAEYVLVESINAAGDTDAAAIRGKDFGQLQEDMLLMDDVIVDVGASNIEEFMKQMRQYRGSYEDFDLFIVPTVKENKQIIDTIQTITALRQIGVPAKKIVVVFNMLDHDDNFEDVFYPLIAFHEAEKAFTLRKKAAILTSDLYAKLDLEKISIEELLGDDKDYKQQLKEARAKGDEAEAQRCASMISMRRLAIGAKENLDEVFAAISK